MIWRNLANHLLSSLFEPPCAACGRTLPRPLDGAVCEQCWASIRTTPSIHDRLGHDGHDIDWTAAVGEYDGALRDVIHALKYEGRRSIGPPLGALMREAGSHLLRGVDLAVPVPLHPRRERARGFNQADDLARALGLPVGPVIRRVRYTRSQIELPKEERQRNVHDAFAIADKPSAFAPGASADKKGLSLRVIVLVDDVATTGATLEACARVLKAAGAAEVRALTAARVVTGRP